MTCLPLPIVYGGSERLLTRYVAFGGVGQAVVDCGAVPWLAQLLLSPSADVREQCAWCLGNIAGDSPKLRDAVLEHEVRAHPHHLDAVFWKEERGAGSSPLMPTSSFARLGCNHFASVPPSRSSAQAHPPIHT